MSLETIVKQEVENEYSRIGKMQLGSDEYVKTVEGCDKMLASLATIEKNRLAERELELQEQKLEEEKTRAEKSHKIELLKVGATILTFAGSLACYIWGATSSREFEREDSHTTEAGRSSERKVLGLMDRFMR